MQQGRGNPSNASGTQRAQLETDGGSCRHEWLSRVVKQTVPAGRIDPFRLAFPLNVRDYRKMPKSRRRPHAGGLLFDGSKCIPKPLSSANPKGLVHIVGRNGI